MCGCTHSSNYRGPSATCHHVNGWNFLKDDVDNHIQLWTCPIRHERTTMLGCVSLIILSTSNLNATSHRVICSNLLIDDVKIRFPNRNKYMLMLNTTAHGWLCFTDPHFSTPTLFWLIKSDHHLNFGRWASYGYFPWDLVSVIVICDKYKRTIQPLANLVQINYHKNGIQSCSWVNLKFRLIFKEHACDVFKWLCGGLEVVYIERVLSFDFLFSLTRWTVVSNFVILTLESTSKIAK